MKYSYAIIIIYVQFYNKYIRSSQMNIFEAIKSLVNFALKNGLIEQEDVIYSINRVCEDLKLDNFEDCEVKEDAELEDILKVILDYACENGLCEDSVTFRDLFDTRIMGDLTPRPSQVIKEFFDLYKKSPKEATDYYYHLSRKSDYIREYRIKNDIKWVTKTEYGDIDITINMSKPEKDAKSIAAALTAKNVSYPKCQLCKENEGYCGRVNHPARQNLRVIPVKLANDDLFLQYSPYVYYNEHCIVFNAKHTPMIVNKEAIQKLLDFVKMFPHYFLGSNAGLPIVGGSILTHEHFQGGCYEFAMTRAEIETPFTFKGYEDVEAGIVKWPMSVIRLRCADIDRLADLCGIILDKWQNYTDEDAFIFAKTDDTNHNAITPIARFRDGKFEMDMVLRNNITTEEFPLGYYHPHPEYHHIKKENIGLIEVMGLAVLPSRLKKEMALLKDAILNNKDIDSIEEIVKHKAWAEELMAKYTITQDNCDEIFRDEIGKIFAAILEQCGVFERTEKGKEQFLKFLNSVNE